MIQRDLFTRPAELPQDTLAAARRALLAAREQGTTCPCCGRYTRLYKRRLNSGMARSLIWLVQHGSGWVDVATTAPRHVVRSREFGKLALWGLAEQKSGADDGRRTSGVWRPTMRGIAFARREQMAPEYAYVYNNHVEEFSDALVSIDEALGARFDYEALMQGE